MAQRFMTTLLIKSLNRLLKVREIFYLKYKLLKQQTNGCPNNVGTSTQNSQGGYQKGLINSLIYNSDRIKLRDSYPGLNFFKHCESKKYKNNQERWVCVKIYHISKQNLHNQQCVKSKMPK